MASSLETGDLSLETAGYEPGIRRYTRRFGAMEERTLIIDSEALLLWAGEAGESNDLMRVDGPLEIGDAVLGGFGVVLDAGGEASAVFDVGIEGITDVCIVNEMDLDAAVATAVQGLSATTEPYNFVATAESFVDVTVSGAAAITEEEPGRWQITYYLFKGSEAHSDYVNYTGDPNTPPQIAVTAEA